MYSNKAKFGITEAVDPARYSFLSRNAVEPGDDSSALFKAFRGAVIVIVPLLLVDAAVYQLQMLVLGGRVPVSAAILKASLLAIFVVAGILRGRFSNRRMIAVGLLFACYLVVDTVYLFFQCGNTFGDTLVSYNIYYLIFVINVLAFCIPLKIPDVLFSHLLVVCFLICVPLGFAQYLTKRPIIPTESVDNNFRVLVWNSPAGLRAFSLFSAPGFFGLYSAFIASLSVALCKKKRNWIFAFPLLALSSAACWISLTRTDLIGLACAMGTAFVAAFGRGRKRLVWLPLLYIFLGAAVGVAAFLLSGAGSGTRSITDTATFTERLYEWRFYLEVLHRADLPTLFFGSGLIQSEKVHTNVAVVPIDNLYLAVTLHIGLIGLVLTMLLFVMLWWEVQRRAVAEGSSLCIAVAASFSTLWCVGIFQIGATALGGILLVCAVSEQARLKSSPKDISQSRRSLSTVEG